jgi:sensor domain CHASE-containing protein
MTPSSKDQMIGPVLKVLIAIIVVALVGVFVWAKILNSSVKQKNSKEINSIRTELEKTDIDALDSTVKTIR